MASIKYTGLKNDEIDNLRSKYGYNSIQTKSETHLLLQILSYFKSPIILILLGASTLSLILGETRDAIIIALMVTLSIILDFVQEYRASNAATKLASKLNKLCTVVRDSKQFDNDLLLAAELRGI